MAETLGEPGPLDRTNQPGGNQTDRPWGALATPLGGLPSLTWATFGFPTFLSTHCLHQLCPFNPQGGQPHAPHADPHTFGTGPLGSSSFQRPRPNTRWGRPLARDRPPPTTLLGDLTTPFAPLRLGPRRWAPNTPCSFLSPRTLPSCGAALTFIHPRRDPLTGPNPETRTSREAPRTHTLGKPPRGTPTTPRAFAGGAHTTLGRCQPPPLWRQITRTHPPRGGTTHPRLCNTQHLSAARPTQPPGRPTSFSAPNPLSETHTHPSTTNARPPIPLRFARAPPRPNWRTTTLVKGAHNNPRRISPRTNSPPDMHKPPGTHTPLTPAETRHPQNPTTCSPLATPHDTTPRNKQARTVSSNGRKQPTNTQQ